MATNPVPLADLPDSLSTSTKFVPSHDLPAALAAPKLTAGAKPLISASRFTYDPRLAEKIEPGFSRGSDVGFFEDPVTALVMTGAAAPETAIRAGIGIPRALAGELAGYYGGLGAQEAAQPYIEKAIPGQGPLSQIARGTAGIAAGAAPFAGISALSALGRGFYERLAERGRLARPLEVAEETAPKKVAEAPSNFVPLGDLPANLPSRLLRKGFD